MICFDWSSPVGFHAEQRLHHISDVDTSKHFVENVSAVRNEATMAGSSPSSPRASLIGFAFYPLLPIIVDHRAP